MPSLAIPRRFSPPTPGGGQTPQQFKPRRRAKRIVEGSDPPLGPRRLEGLFEPVILKLARCGRGCGDFGEAAGGIEGAGFDEVVARVEEEAGEALGPAPGLRGGEQGLAAAAPAVFRGDVEAGELAGRVDAEVARGDAVGAQD